MINISPSGVPELVPGASQLAQFLKIAEAAIQGEKKPRSSRSAQSSQEINDSRWAGHGVTTGSAQEATRKGAGGNFSVGESNTGEVGLYGCTEVASPSRRRR